MGLFSGETLWPTPNFGELRKAEVQLRRIRFKRNTNVALCRGMRLAVANSGTLLAGGGIKRCCDKVASISRPSPA